MARVAPDKRYRWTKKLSPDERRRGTIGDPNSPGGAFVPTEQTFEKILKQPVERRRIKQRLDAVLAARRRRRGEPQGNHVAGARTPKPFLVELQKSVKELSDLLDDKRHEGDDMKPPVEELQKKLEAWLQKKPA